MQPYGDGADRFDVSYFMMFTVRRSSTGQHDSSKMIWHFRMCFQLAKLIGKNEPPYQVDSLRQVAAKLQFLEGSQVIENNKRESNVWHFYHFFPNKRFGKDGRPRQVGCMKILSNCYFRGRPEIQTR